MEGDVEAQRDFMRGSNALKYDSTQHYKASEGKGEEKSGAVHAEQAAVIIGAD